MKPFLLPAALLLGLCAAPSTPLAFAAPAAPAANAPAITDADRDMVKKVTDRLIAAVKDVPQGMNWPPEVRIAPENQRNAYATFTSGPDNNKLYPLMVVYKGTLDDIVQNIPDRLAFVMGHELAHLTLQHPLPDPKREKTPFLKTTLTRSQEEAADELGIKYVLAAGYDFRRAISGIERWVKDFPGDNYSSFEGVGVDHPTWSDRMALLDKEGAQRWKNMSAFANGVLFLKVEQYADAAKCFERVTKAFPSAWDAWANLGYARLMLYCDGIDSDNLRRFDIGQIVIGGFYNEFKSNDRGEGELDEEMWLEAVGALRESIRIKPDQPLVQANLGTAYLLKPTGKDVGQAQGFFETAYNGAKNAKLDDIALCAITVNSGVASLASGQTAAGKTLLDSADTLAKRSFGGRGGGKVLTDALAYNRALLLSRSSDAGDKKAAASQLETYLKGSSSASSWWPLAFERYQNVSKEVGLTAKAKTDLVSEKPEDFRLVTGVDVAGKGTLTLSQELGAAQTQMGETTGVPILSGTSLRRYSWEAQGVEALATDQILAIFLRSPNSPALTLRASGIGGATTTLRVGMSREELERALGDDNYDYTQLTDPDLNYRFWRSAGIAARLKEGKVVELVVVQAPKARTLGGA